jgi:hypothetical protein
LLKEVAMSDFDDDPVVRDQLQRLGGHYPDEDLAYAAVVQGARRFKRRRAVVGAGGLCAVLLFGFGAGAVFNRDTQQLSPALSSVEDDDQFDDESTSTAVTTTDATTTTSTTMAESTTSSSEPESAEATEVPEVTAPEPTLPASSVAGSHSSSSSSSTSHSSGDGHSTSTSTTYSGTGGSISVKVTDGVIAISGHTTTPGFQMIIDKNEPQRVRVFFVNSRYRTRIDVEVVDGVLIGNTKDDEIDDGPANTFNFPDDQGENNGGDNGSGGRG